jgi:hypothetical protein
MVSNEILRDIRKMDAGYELGEHGSIVFSLHLRVKTRAVTVRVKRYS